MDELTEESVSKIPLSALSLPQFSEATKDTMYGTENKLYRTIMRMNLQEQLVLQYIACSAEVHIVQIPMLTLTIPMRE